MDPDITPFQQNLHNQTQRDKQKIVDDFLCYLVKANKITSLEVSKFSEHLMPLSVENDRDGTRSFLRTIRQLCLLKRVTRFSERFIPTPQEAWDSTVNKDHTAVTAFAQERALLETALAKVPQEWKTLIINAFQML